MKRAHVWIAGLALADAAAFALTIHADETFRRTRGGTSVMTLGQALGWMVSVGLLVILVLVLFSRFRSRH